MREPPPPPDSAKNALIGALKAASELPDPASERRIPNSQDENRELFIRVMPDPVLRQIAFNVVERNCRKQFAQGADGVQLYVRLLTYVRLANVPEAVDEFERQFGPMLDQQALHEWKTITGRFKQP